MARSEDVKTPLCRFAYTGDLFKARENEQGVKKWGCTLLIPKGDAGLAALQEAALQAATAEWGDKAAQWIKDGVVKSPFLDGDGPQAISKKSGERHEGFAGHVFIRVSSGVDYRPKIVDQRRLPITEPDELYSGCYGYAVINAYTWTNDKNGKGISFSVSALQRAKDGERLGGAGGVDPDKVFDKIEDTGAAPEAAKTGTGAAGLFG